MRIAGFSVTHLAEVDSTNDYLSRRLNELPHHSLVYADIQTRGRGRLERGWDSLLRGNLYASLLIKDAAALSAGRAANFTQLIAVSAVAAAREFGADIGIKWPNDLFAGEAKIGGILSEARHGAGGFRGVIAGLGFNIAAAPRLPETARYRAVSLAEICPDPALPSPEKFLNALIAGYTDRYPSFVQRGFPAIAEEYADALLFTRRPLQIEEDGFSGEYAFAGVNDAGELLVRRADGHELTVRAGDVIWKR
jgi:BirA family biotin operon repressor/biotin-[acetyl-CoA-carboxylase] ligase